MSSSVPPSTSAISTEANAEEPQRDSSFLRYISTKLGGAALSLLMVVILGFFLFRILPGDPVAAIARERQMTPEQVQLLRESYGLDKSLGEQFIDYIVNVFTLNFGESYVYSQSVSSLIADYFWPTILLTGTSAILAIILGLWLGTRAGWKRNSRFDKFVSSSSLVFWSVPTFWLGLLLLMVFGGTLGWFPTGGMVSPGSNATGFALVLDVAHHLVLPAVSMGAVSYAHYLLVMRASLLEELHQDYLRDGTRQGAPRRAGAHTPRDSERVAAHCDDPGPAPSAALSEAPSPSRRSSRGQVWAT